MRMREAARALGGALAVYVAIAACSASTAPSADVDAGGPIGVAPPTSSGVDAMIDAVVDAVVGARDAVSEPVPDAKAQATPEVTTVQCVQSPPTGPDYRAAEQAYPGRTAADIAMRLTALANYAPGSLAPLPGYSQATRTAYVRDGSAGVFCTPDVTSITFILRP